MIFIHIAARINPVSEMRPLSFFQSFNPYRDIRIYTDCQREKRNEHIAPVRKRSRNDNRVIFFNIVFL